MLVRVSLLGDQPGNFEVLLTRAPPAPPQTFAALWQVPDASG